MDPWLLILTIIFTFLLILINTYVMIIYIHPDDKGLGNALFYKILVVAGLTLSFGQVMMIPLDISNSRTNGSIDMLVFWQMVYVLIFIMLVFILPFAIFLYESDPDHPLSKRICGAMIY